MKTFTFAKLTAFAVSALIAVGAQAETTLEKIKRTGTVTVGTEAAFPPFEFVENGKIVGYGKDILETYENNNFSCISCCIRCYNCIFCNCNCIFCSYYNTTSTSTSISC